MRLLNTSTLLLHDFPPNRIPPYAILSHTWGDDEVTFADLALPRSTYETRPGWQKIVLTCEQAVQDGLSYAWVDTCCIDKSSSAELSEAINSMFAYYRHGAKCYAYLVDVQDVSEFKGPTTELALSESRWFTRGWTLQELLAPTEVYFYSKHWGYIGTRTQLARRISAVTGIDPPILKGSVSLQSVCVARRMSWVSHRQTTRPEDMAYCVLGLFDIHMPTLYGEGDKAFLRLQEEILRTSDDQSLFAWVDPSAPENATSGLLASSPAMFKHSSSVVAFRDWTEPSLPFSMSNAGLTISLPLDRQTHYLTTRGIGVSKLVASDGPRWRAFLNCSWSNDRRGRIYIELECIGQVTKQYCRVKLWSTLQAKGPYPAIAQQIFVRQAPTKPLPQDIVPPQGFRIGVQTGSSDDDYVIRAYLHDEAAVQNKNWYSLLLRQKAFDVHEVGETIFYIPGQPRQLALVLLMEYLPTLSKFFVLIGSGHNSHLPQMDYRVLRPSEHVLYNDLQHFLRSSRVIFGVDTSSASFRLDRSPTIKKSQQCEDWLKQFRVVYDPLSGSNVQNPNNITEDKTCTKFSMQGVDHHLQIERSPAQDGGPDRLHIRMRIGGHMYSKVGEEDLNWESCSTWTVSRLESLKLRANTN